MDYPRRRSIRLPGYNYAAPGWYFVTTCMAGRRRLLAYPVDGELCLTTAGEIVQSMWSRIPEKNPGVDLDKFVVMPDHLHGIVILRHDTCDESGIKSLTGVIGAFKSASAREIRQQFPGIGPVWQRSFHEHIIRSERALHAIRRYIDANPFRWILTHHGTP